MLNSVPSAKSFATVNSFQPDSDQFDRRVRSKNNYFFGARTFTITIRTVTIFDTSFKLLQL
jgi:hypothetical protein